MSAPPSRALVRHAPPPAPPVDYRLDLSRGTVAGYLALALGAGFLLFLSGLVIGIRMQREIAAAAPPAAEAAAPGAPVRPAAEAAVVPAPREGE